MTHIDVQQQTFPTDLTGLPASRLSEVVELANGEAFELRIGAVATRIGDDTVRMVAYNGSVPGQTLRLRQGSEVDVRVRNDGDHETTVHWHGLRVASGMTACRTRRRRPSGRRGVHVPAALPRRGLYWDHGLLSLT